MTDIINRSWEQDVLINDAFGKEFSLNNLLTFQADNSSHVVERKTNLPLVFNLNWSINASHHTKEKTLVTFATHLFHISQFFCYPSRDLWMEEMIHLTFLLWNWNPCKRKQKETYLKSPKKETYLFPMEKVLVNKLIIMTPFLPLKLTLMKYFVIPGLCGKQLKK